MQFSHCTNDQVRLDTQSGCYWKIDLNVSSLHLLLSTFIVMCFSMLIALPFGVVGVVLYTGADLVIWGP